MIIIPSGKKKKTKTWSCRFAYLFIITCYILSACLFSQYIKSKVISASCVIIKKKPTPTKWILYHRIKIVTFLSLRHRWRCRNQKWDMNLTRTQFSRCSWSSLSECQPHHPRSLCRNQPRLAVNTSQKQFNSTRYNALHTTHYKALQRLRSRNPSLLLWQEISHCLSDRRSHAYGARTSGTIIVPLSRSDVWTAVMFVRSLDSYNNLVSRIHVVLFWFLCRIFSRYTKCSFKFPGKMFTFNCANNCYR